MNKRCFKTVFSARLGTLLAVGEHTSGHGKANGAHGAGTLGAQSFRLAQLIHHFVGALTASFVLVTLAWAQPAVNALPTGGQVAQGAVQFNQSAQQLNINQASDRAAVNWQSFDIGAAAKVNVVQPSAQAVLLNRVGGTAPSQIFGQLSANGRVILVNPNGMVFGKDGSVSASAFTGSTLNISDADFMAGNERYTRDGAAGAIVNRGLIQAAPGGYVALLGASVSNEGHIVAPQGNVFMAASDAVTLPSPTVGLPIGQSGRIKLELTPASINAAVANQKGGTIVTEGGQVYLQAAAVNAALATIIQRGSIDTTGEQGGAVHVLADGGRIRVDGSIKANSTGSDDKGQAKPGGDIYIGRDKDTNVLAAVGDASGANLESKGGFVETSGQFLKVDGALVTAKEWLLDPTNITIASSGASGTTYSSSFTAGTNSTILASDINASLNAGTNVTIATSASGGDLGNINVNASIAKTGGSFASLTLRAHNDIVVAANTTITSTSDNLNVTLNSDFDGSGAGAIVMNTDSGITSNGGNIALGGGSAGNASDYSTGYASVLTGVSLNSSSLNAGGGNISIKGKGTTVFTNSSDMRGVNLNGATVSTSGSGSIVIDGISGNSNVSNLNVGIGLVNSATITADTGAITLTGSAAATTTGGYYNSGIWVWGSGSRITGAGAVTLTGVGGGSTYAALNQGVRIEGGQVRATGTGTLTVQGTAGVTSGTAEPNAGVEISANGLLATDSGNVSITGLIGTAGSTDVLLKTGGSVTSSSGNITFTGNSYSGDTTENVNAGSGNVTLQNRTTGTLLDVGGTSADVTSGTRKLGISSAELARITAGTIMVGRSDATSTGNVAINALNMGAFGYTGGNLSVLSGGNIAVNGAVTKTAGTDATLSLLAYGDITVAANTTITGTSGMLNVVLNSDFNANDAGAIVMNTGSGITSNGGNISLGGGSAGSAESYATGNSTNPNGVLLQGASLLSNGGNITLRGKSTSGSTLYDFRSNGIRLRDASGNNVINAGSGQIAMYGLSASTGSDAAYGIEISQYGTPTYSTELISSNSSSAILLDGAGSTASSSVFRSGVYINAKGTVSATGNGGVSIIATSGGVGEALSMLNGSTINTSTANASVTVSADSASISATASINAGTGTVTLQNRTAGTLIDVGGADALTGSPLRLGISNAELNRITAGTTKVGSTTAGNLTVTTATTTAASTGNLYLQTNGSATVNASSAVASGAGLLIQTTGGSITTNAAISGSNISLDNTNGTINWVTGELTAGTSSGSATNAVNVASSITATGNVNILGNVATSTNTGVNVTSAGSITSSGTAATVNITSNGHVVNEAPIKVTGATGTDANINLTSTSGTITGAGAIGDTIDKNASVTYTQSGTSTYSGGINAANFTKAGTGSLTLNSWIATPAVATKVSNAYTVNAGSLTLETGGTYAQINPASVNVVNASTFALSNASNGWWNSTAFHFTGGLGGGTMNLGGNPVGVSGTTNTFSTSGGATNTINGVFNANSATVNMNLTSATSGTVLLDGSFAALNFRQNTQTGFGLQNGGTVNVSGGGHLLIRDRVAATAFNINAGNVQVGDGSAATAAATATLEATNVSIASGSKLTFNRAEAYTNSSSITGTGDLIQAGPGVLTLAGNSTGFAGATTVNAGRTLAMGTGGSLGAAGSTLTLTDASSNLSFTNTSGVSTMGSTISGTGTVTKTGADGTGLLLGNNTYSGATTITSGTLQVGNGGTTGTLGTGSVTDNSALVFDRSDDVIVSNFISGSGTLTQAGTGTVLLTNNNGYTGQTHVNAGTLSLGTTATSGTADSQSWSSQFNIASGAVLDFNSPAGVTLNNQGTVFTGAGTITKTGAGGLTWNRSTTHFSMLAGSLIDVKEGSMTGSTTYHGRWANNLSSLNVAAGASFLGAEGDTRVDALTGSGSVSFGWSTLGSLTVGVNNSAAGAYNMTAGTATFSGALSGPAPLNKIGTGTQILTGTNTYAGVTTITEGTLQIGAGGLTGTLGSGAVTKNASLVFNRSNSLTVNNAISGTGTLNQDGTGTTVLTGTNNYSGTTSINAGTLQIGNGGTAGTLGTGAVVDNGILAINRSDAVSLTQAISGTGSVLQMGTGTTTIASNNNTFSGGITISKGTVLIGNGGETTGNYNNNSGTGTITLGDANTGASNVALQLESGTAASGSSQVALSNAIVVSSQGTGTATIAAVLGTGDKFFTQAQGTLTLNRDVVLNDSTTDRFGYNGKITGTGNVSITGTRVTLGTPNANGVSTNDFVGNVTIASGSILQAGAKNVLPSASNVTNNGTLRLLDGADQAFNALSGTGTITTLNTTANLLTNLSLGNNNGSATFSGTITGSSPVLSLTKNGTGTQILTGSNTYTGDTTINEGTLQVGNGASAGSLGIDGTVYSAVSVAANANLDFYRSNVGLNIPNAISGAGVVNFMGTGVSSQSSYNLTGNNSGLTGNINVSSSRIAINAANQVGSAAITVNSGAALYAHGSFTVNNTLSLAGNGWLENTYGQLGALRLQSGTTYAGAITLAADARIGAYASTGTVSGVISGSRNLDFNSGSGTVILTGNNNYTGATTVSGGTLQVGNAGSTGTLGVGDVTLSNNASLRFVRSTDTVIANAITGAGNVSATITGVGSDLAVDRSIAITGGTLNLAADGNLSVTQGIGTNNTSTTALVLNAGAATSAGTASGGDITFSGSGGVSVGSGGRATLFTGSLIGSTGLGVSSGNNRYNSDETTTSYTTALGAGSYAIYREAPTLTATFNNASKTYNGLAYSGGNGLVLTGFANGETNAQLGTITYSGTSQGAINAGDYAISGSAVSGLGYSLAYTAGTLTVNKANLALSGTRVYDGSKTFAGTSLTASGVNGETFAITGAGDTSNLVSKNVQTNQALNSITGLALGASANGGLSTNYNALSTAGSSVSVTAKAVTLTAGNVSKTYDGGTAYTTTNADLNTLSGQLLAGDAVTAAGISFANKDAGTGNKTITLSSATLSDGNNGANYAVTLAGNSTSTIHKADLTLSGTRVYDATQTFAGSYLTASGVNGETFELTGAGDTSNLASKNVQTNQALNSTTGLALGASGNGGLSTNYNALSTAGSSVSVTAKAATYAATATTLTYNGTLQNQAASSKTGFISGDALTFAGEASGTNADTYGSNLNVGGADFSNYSITTTNANLVIGKSNLTLSGTRVYDATQNFAGSHLTASGVNDETFAITGAGDTSNLASKNVQTNQALNSITGLALGTSTNGGLSSNYNALSATGSNVNVTAKSATVDATPTTLTYNGLTQTQQASTSSGFIAGDAITISGLASGKNANTYSSALSVSGADAGNYTITLNDANLQITKAALTATGNSVSTTYNGANQSVSGYAITGFVGTDTASDLTNNIVASGAEGINAGNYTNTVTAGAQTNYTVSTVNGTLSIAKAPLTATGKSSSVTYNGFNQSDAADFDVTGLQGNDTKASLSSVAALGATGKNAGNYANVVTAGTETNYTVTPVNGNLQIGKASLTATGNSANVTYNGATQTVAGFTVSGLLGSDTQSGLTSISASGASGKNVASYTNTVTAGTETNYTVSTVNGSLEIGRANLTLSGSKVYDTSTTFAGSALTALGAAGETFSVTGAGHASNLASKDVQSAQLLSSVTGLALGTSSNGGLSANYNDLSTTGSSVSVTPAAASVTGTLTNVTYNGTAQTQSSPATSGFFGGDEITVSGLASGKNAGTYTSTLAVDGADAGNYTVTYTNSNLVVAQAPLTVTATQVTKTYDAGLGAAGHGTVDVLAGAAMGDVVNSAGAQAFLDKDAGIGKTVRASGVTIKDAANADMTGNYAITYVDNTTSVINQAPLTVTANADARFVTQSDAALFNGVSYSGLVGGEDSTVLGGTLGISRTNAANDVGAGIYTGVLVPSGLTSNNYDITFANGNYQIIPANQLLIRTTNGSVVYGNAPTYNTTAQYVLDDGVNPSSLVTLSRTGSANNFTFSDGAGGSVSTLLKPYLNNAAAAISGSTNTVVGTYDVMDSNPTVVGGNFVGAPVFVGALTIKTKDVAPSATSVSKVYDGTTSMNNVVVGMTGQIAGDNLAISGSGAFTQKNAGTDLGYTVSNIALSGGDAANYHLSGGATSFSGANGIISAAPLVLTTSNVTKTYDGTTAAAGSALSTQGTQLFGSDSLSGGNFAFTNANAGVSSKTVTVSGVTVNDGNGGANYAVTYANNTTSTINPKALNASYTASNKTYNGNLTASVSGGSDDIIGGDAVNFTNTSATFDTKNVGTGKTVTVTGIGISGADAGNYSLQSTTVTSTADITAKALTASFTGTSKVYDGGVAASVTGSSADMVAGDVLTYNVTSASFDNKNVGTNKQITASGITLGGADGGNYVLQNTTATATGAITRKDVTLSAITASGKTYDGTVAASITAGSITTGVAGETLSVSGSGTFDTKNVGLGKTVTVADVGSLSKVNGTGDWDNYNLATTGAISTTAGITQAALTVTASAVSKTYDGTLSAGGSGVVGALAGAGDAVNGVGTQAFLDKNAGTGKAVRASGVTIQDASNADMTGNYLITYVDNTGGVINRAPLEVTASSVTKTYDGTLSATGSAVVRTGTLLAGDALSGGTFAFTDKNQGAGNKTVTVSGVTVGDGVNTNNYDVTYANNTTSTINKANLTVTAAGVTKTYDGTLSAVGTGSVGTLAGAGAGETVDVAGMLAFLDANAGTGKTVRASGVTLKDAGNADVTGNYAITYVDSSNGVINKAALTASLVGPISKQYDGTVAASDLTNANFSVTGWANAGEGVTVNLTSANYADPNVAANGGTGAVSAVLLDSDFSANGATNLANYTLPSTANGNVGTITPAPLTVKVNNTAMFVTQNPNTAFDQGFSYTGLKNGETGSAVLGTLTRTYAGPANPATGSYSAVYELTTPPTAANYTVTVQKGDLTVARADQLLLNVGSANATYGALSAGNAAAGATLVTAQYCLVSTDCNAGNIANLTMSNPGAGRWTATDSTNSTISFNTVVDTSGQISGAGFVNVGQYGFDVNSLSTTGNVNFNGSVVSGGVLTVTPKALTFTASNVTKVYDGTTALAAMGLTPTGKLSGDQVSVASSGGTFAGKNVGSQSFSLTGLQLQGADRANYTFSTNTVSGTGTITPKTLTLSASASDKVYDGNATASVGALGLSGVIAGDAVSATGGTASFSDKNVARNASGSVMAKSVSISGVTLTGSDAANYQTDSSASASAVITPLTINASVTALNKVYDGTAQAQVNGTLTGILGSDVVSVTSTSSSFASKNVVRDVTGQPTSQSVNVAGLTLTGADAGNYNLANTTASSTATITPKSLSASGAVADKVYDGSAQASLTGLNGTGLLAGDSVSVEANIAHFEDQLVSRDATGAVMTKLVTVEGLRLAGLDAGNYALMGSSLTARAKILPRELDVLVNAQDKVYDGSAVATGSLSLSHVVAGDVLALSWGKGSFDSKDVQRNAQGGVQAQGVRFESVRLSGADSGNYSLKMDTASGMATITPKRLEVIGTQVADKKEDGSVRADVRVGVLSGFLGAEQLRALASGQFRTPGPGQDKPVDVLYSLQDGENGGKAGNYELVGQTLKASITPVNVLQLPRTDTPIASKNSRLRVLFDQSPWASFAPAQSSSGRTGDVSLDPSICTAQTPNTCSCNVDMGTGVEICLPVRER